ncbi:methionine vitamin-b12 [Colletotrichum higginsianum]|nr:methionine vitamin-b12 [Colletotrichum higginsianum]
MAPLFRADQVGSLIRPDFLLEDRASLGFYADKLSADQAYERTIFFGGFFENLEGMEVRQDLRIPQDFRPGLPNVTGLAKMGLQHFAAVVATGKIKHVSSAYLPAWEMIKKSVPEEYWKDCKMSIPSITWQHMYLAKGTAFTPGTYASDQEYFLDLAAAFRAELKALYDAGLRSVQVDDPNLTFFIVEQFREGLGATGSTLTL